ncbi:MAG: alpha/beta fold hydrolase [Lachnospiraceae bacterium]|nr:alpha/beta fold hydrolase [Lachnospiraceae bacterium]
MRKKLFLGIIMVSTTMLLFACKANHSEEEDKTASKQTDDNEKNETKKDMKKDVINVEELCIQNGENTIYGKLYVPVEEGKHPVIILSHGYNGTNNDFVNECKYYAQNGYLAYAFDFCGGSGGSKSTGKTTDMTIFTEKSDVLAIFDYFQTMENVDTEQIFLFGGSQGGLVTALAAEERAEKVKGMILYFPAFSIPDDWRKNYPDIEKIPETVDFWGLKLGRNFFTDIHDFYTFDNIGSYDKDVLILHGDRDEIVPLSYSVEAQKKYPHAELITMNGEGHGFSPTGANTAKEKVLEYLQKHTDSN